MRVAVLLAAVVTLLAVAPSTSATIVVQRGIAGAELRMSKAEVRARLGTPQKVKSGTNDFGRYTTFVYARVTVTFQGSRVTGLRTRSRLERTASGVGVGSSEAAVKARVPGVRCRTELGFRHCVVGAFKPGRIVTAFTMAHGRVTTIVIGLVLD